MTQLPDRLLTRLDYSSGCWLWLGHRTEQGYGRIKLDRKVQATHRVVYRTLVGPIAPGLQSDHTCKVRHCCNPLHLEPVPPVINVSRASNFNRAKTHCKYGHAFTPENTRISTPTDRSAPRRTCIACQVRLSAAHYWGAL